MDLNKAKMTAQIKAQDDILSYREMCDAEGVQTLQRGMNFRMKPSYSVILMSQRTNTPYHDRVCDDGVTIEYEGHDVPRRFHDHNPKNEDQPDKWPNGKPTQNGLFILAIDKHKENRSPPELIKVYEKIIPGIWSLKGYFDLVDYKQVPCLTRFGKFCGVCFNAGYNAALAGLNSSTFCFDVGHTDPG